MPETAFGVVVAAIITGLASLVVSIVTLVTGSRTARLQLEAAKEALESQRHHHLELELRQQRQTLHVSLLALLNPSSVQTTHLAHWQSIAEAVFTRDPSAIEERFDEVHSARLLALDQIWSLIARLSLVAKNKHALVATLPLTWRDPNSTDHAYINAARAEFGVPPLPLVFRS